MQRDGSQKIKNLKKNKKKLLQASPYRPDLLGQVWQSHAEGWKPGKHKEKLFQAFYQRPDLRSLAAGLAKPCGKAGWIGDPPAPPFLQSNALGFARFSDADMNSDEAARGGHGEKEFRLFGGV